MAEITPDGGRIIRIGKSFRAAYTAVDCSVDWETEWFDFPGWQMNFSITRLAFPSGSNGRRFGTQVRCVVPGMSPGASPEFAVGGRVFTNDGYLEQDNLQMPTTKYFKATWGTSTSGPDALLMCPGPTRLVWVAASDSGPGFCNVVLYYIPMHGA